ncbi:hypothetical protein OG806_49010 [Streptomyces sp. NBC_00882]|uniref:hypothetical protein n=1 Tax=Streptomyces TaxID=1883 RepID=UPI0038689ACF|nr:hypothetical protein OG806_49010 [Streptomyces sp. NBC_00882]WSZ63758.1 hypothetical protein OH824_48290 [Streptomyces canus]
MSETIRVPDIPAPVGQPRFSVDRTGWVTVKASPQWWRATAQSDGWADIAEQLAIAGEDSTDPRMCRVIGATTKMPCKIDTSREPCPHHGEGNETNRCGAQKAKGGPCRWNLVVHGECPNHPQTWQRILEERRKQEEEERQRRADIAERWAAEQAQRERDAQTLPCSYCDAESEAPCIRPGTEESASRLHTPRFKLLDHRHAAAQAECTSCGAQRKALCQTSSGKDAADAHAARVRAAAG